MITKISYSYGMPNGGDKSIETYQLDKRQSIVINASHSRTASETNIGNRVVACNTQNCLEAKFMGNMKKPTKIVVT